MRNNVSDLLLDELRQLDDTVAELDTIIARANELPLPEREPADPDVIAAAAAEPDAPPELRAVATAVAEGRTSWAEVAAPGGATDLQEIQDLRAAGARLTIQMMTKEGKPEASQGEPDEDEDFADDSIYD